MITPHSSGMLEGTQSFMIHLLSVQGISITSLCTDGGWHNNPALITIRTDSRRVPSVVFFLTIILILFHNLGWSNFAARSLSICIHMISNYPTIPNTTGVPTIILLCLTGEICATHIYYVAVKLLSF